MPNPDAPDCGCKWLEDAAKSDYMSVIFDRKMNEYHFVHEGGQGYSLIYHCPFCGGKAPKSLRETYWTEPESEEIHRLDHLARNFMSIDDVIASWGEPDQDHEIGGGSITPGSETEASVHRVSGRRIVYSNLSDSTEVHVCIDRYGKLKFSYQGKYIGSNNL